MINRITAGGHDARQYIVAAGRDVIMESLTQAERTLLANVRQLDRFRRGFYVQTITGRRPGDVSASL